MTDMVQAPILQVKHLAVAFDTERGPVRAVDDVDFSVMPGQVLGIAGESGCGKSVTALSILRLLPKPAARIAGGQIQFKGRDLTGLPIEQMHAIRGRQISMIFQEPMTALNPVHTVGRQLCEVYCLHFSSMDPLQRAQAAVTMLERVGIAAPEKVMTKYPHQLSGGMRQRVMIAMALACEPDILIADEPTTALDVTVQAQIMDLIFDAKNRLGMAVILITHDLGVIAENCDEVVVMYAGTVAERADIHSLFKSPRHPYTRGLLASIPSRAQVAKTRLPTIGGTVPSLSKIPDGCRFADRCLLAHAPCQTLRPELRSIAKSHSVACHLADCE